MAVLVRFGLLAVVTAMISGNLLSNQPVPPSLTTWWAGGTWLTFGLLLLPGGYAFSRTLGHRRLLAGDPLGDD